MVTFESVQAAGAYETESDANWPIMIDERRYLYSHYQMERANFWDLWGPATWLAYARQLLKGNFPKKIMGDIHQRGGDVLIDGQGQIRLHHVGTGPADRPQVESIIDFVKRNGK